MCVIALGSFWVIASTSSQMEVYHSALEICDSCFRYYFAILFWTHSNPSRSYLVIKKNATRTEFYSVLVKTTATPQVLTLAQFLFSKVQSKQAYSKRKGQKTSG